MTLFDCFLGYITEIAEGKRQPPPPVTLQSTDEAERMAELARQVSAMGVADFVRACAAQDGTVLPDELFAGDATAPDMAPVTSAPSEPDPDAGKHIFEVFLDCIALDDGLVQYLIQTLKNDDRAAFYKLCQITVKADLDPHEFLYWLGHREEYADEEEAACAAIMDGCLTRLVNENQRELAAALLSGNKTVFEVFRCEAPELQHLPAATWEWYSRHYLDRDYPIRLLMKWNGIVFPETL